MTTRTKKATKAVFTDLIQFLALISLQITLAPLVLKTAGQDVLGAYSIIMQIIGYGLILDFGLGVALTRYLAQSFDETSAKITFIKVFNVGRLFLLVTNLLLSCFILILAMNITTVLSDSNLIIDDTKKCLFLFAIWTIVKTPFLIYGLGLRASQNIATNNIIGLFVGVCRLILSLSFVYSGFGLIGLIAANVIAEFFGLFFQKAYFKKYYCNLNLKWQRPDIPLSKEIFKFGLAYWGVNVAIVLATGSDSLIIGSIYGSALVAVFYTTKLPTFMLIQLIYKISDSSGPAMNQLISLKEISAVRIAYLKILRYSLLLAFPLAIGIVTLNESVISLWVGNQLYAGHFMSISLAVFAITQVCNHINAMMVVALGNMQYWITVSIFTGFMTIINAYIFCNLFNVQWVMIVIAIMDIPAGIFLFYRTLNRINIIYKTLWINVILPIILTTLPLIVCSVYIIKAIKTDSISGLILAICIYLLFWLLGLFTFGINDEERALIKNKINQIKVSKRT